MCFEIKILPWFATVRLYWSFLVVVCVVELILPLVVSVGCSGGGRSPHYWCLCLSPCSVGRRWYVNVNADDSWSGSAAWEHGETACGKKVTIFLNPLALAQCILNNYKINWDRWSTFICKWVRSRNCGCLVTWFCYQLIAKLGNNTATVSWPDPNRKASQ